MCALSLLGQDSLDAATDGFFERHLAQASLGVCGREQPRELPARLHHRNRTNPLGKTVLWGDRSSPVNDLAKLLGELPVPLSSGLGSNLQGDGIEALFVAFGVTRD